MIRAKVFRPVTAHLVVWRSLLNDEILNELNKWGCNCGSIHRRDDQGLWPNTRKMLVLKIALVFALMVVVAACLPLGANRSSTCPVVKIDNSETVSEQLACLYDYLQSPNAMIIADYSVLRADTPLSYIAAVSSLVESGYLAEVSSGAVVEGSENQKRYEAGLPVPATPAVGYYPTAEGMEYLFKHRHPALAWLKANWFPLAIAILNAVIGVVAVWTAKRARSGNG